MPRNNQRARAQKADAALIRSSYNRTFDDLNNLASFVEEVATSVEVTNMIRRAGLNERMHLRIGDRRGRTSYTLGPEYPGLWEISMPRGDRPSSACASPWSSVSSGRTPGLCIGAHWRSMV